MAEYIERESLLNEIRENKLMLREPAAKRIIGIIESVTAADVRPERHGHWDDSDGEHTKCSICGYFAPIIPQYQDEPITYESPYCPHCGTKMDGKGGGTNEET